MNKYSSLQRPYTSDFKLRTLNSNPSAPNILSRNYFPLKTREQPVSPEDSQYQINLNYPPRPSTVSLSSLTYHENQRLKNQNLVSQLNHHNANSTQSLKTISSKMPSERDFNRLLDRLEMVISTKALAHKKVTLKEGQPVEIILMSETTQFFKVFTKARKCPLRVEITRFKGRLKTYVSREVSEPNETLHDQAFRFDKFQVSDSGLKFRGEQIFIGVFAVTDANFSICVNFGREKLQKKEPETYEAPKTNQEKKEFPKETPKSAPKMKTFFGKNFVELNKQVESPLSPKSMRKRKLLSHKWDLRRKSAVEKRKAQIKEKQEKTIKLLKRHEIRREEERKLREYNEYLQVLKARQRGWLCLIFFSKAMSAFSEMRNQGRSSHLKSLQESAAARKIQKGFKTSTKHLTPEHFALLRARNLLMVFSFQAKPILTSFVNSKLLNCIYDSATNHTLPHSFERLHSKIRLVETTFLEYSKRKSENWETLVKMWDKALEKLITNSTRHKHKGKRSRKLDNTKYLKITAIARNQTLTEYIRKQKKEYIRLLRNFKQSNKELMRKGVRAFQSELKETLSRGNKVQLPVMPEFNLLPSEQELLGLIEKAAKFS